MTVNKDMTIGQVLEQDSSSFAMGMHCVGCPASIGETLEEAAQVHGFDVNELINKLNEYFAQK